MVAASKGFMKNPSRSQAIHRMVNAIDAGTDKEGYSQHVRFNGIERNQFNLNYPH